ncbi:MAG: DUF930 domain-containing protein [Devosia sp.]
MSSVSLLDPLPSRPAAPWGALASFVVHIGLALALILVSPLRPLVVPPPEPVSVEIVTEAEFTALRPRPAGPLQRVQKAGTPSSETELDRLPPSSPLEPNLETSPTITANEFYAERLLGEPGMAHVARELRGLTVGERAIQLCNIEGLEQIRRTAPQFDPDTLVPYAMLALATDRHTVSAVGGAFRSRRKWYGIAFTCTVGDNLDGVTGFEFTLGDAIPEDQWDAHDLTAQDEDE